jgi:anti-anti-sigma factor
VELKVEKRGESVILFIKGRLDAVTAGELEAKLTDIIQNEKENIIISMDALEYISSAGLRVILLIAKKLHALGRKIGFAAVSGNVKDVFDISGFYALFEIHDTLDDTFFA